MSQQWMQIHGKSIMLTVWRSGRRRGKKAERHCP